MMEERLRINDNIKTAMMLAVVLYHSCMFLLEHGLIKHNQYIRLGTWCFLQNI